MKLKKLLAVSLLISTPVTWAADTAKVTLVKQIYREAVANPDSSMDILKKYADTSLKQAIRKSENAEEICLEADPIWNSQDPEITKKIKVSELSNGKVRASFSQYGSRVNVDYSVNCTGHSCKITDVDDFKNMVRQCQ